VSPGATFERVYLALKAQLGSGCYRAGESLEPSALSQDLNASITPIRDALHRLVGEGLVDSPRGDGFRAPWPTEMAVRHAYRWSATLLELGARARTAPALEITGPALPAETSLITATEHLFLAIAARSGNPEHAGALANLNARLRPFRIVEAELIPGGREELDAMAELAGGGTSALRRSLVQYHRRRERLAAEIVARLHQP
jgi:DNA-binding transcriptional MocR family regulator